MQRDEKKPAPKFTSEQIRGLRNLQKKWREHLYDEGKSLPLRLGKKHPKELKEFVNDEKVRKSLHLAKRKTLLKSIQTGKMQQAIFKDKSLSQLAFTLYERKEISRDQYVSIIDRKVTEQELGTVKTYPILDAENRFTHEAHELLIPTLIHQYPGLQQLENKSYLETFRLAVLALPKSEQVFYKTSAESFKPFEMKDDNTRQPLTDVMVRTGAMHYDSSENNRGLVHLTVGVTNALNFARFGSHAIPIVPRLGKISSQAVEAARDAETMLRETCLPTEEKPKTVKVHGFTASQTEARQHDVHHENVLASVPKPLRKAFSKLIDITRWSFTKTLAQESKHKPNTEKDLFSKEIWEWVACDFRYFLQETPAISNKYFLNQEDLYTSKLTPKLLTALFCEMLIYGNQTDGTTIKTKYGKSVLGHGSHGYLFSPEDLTVEFSEKYMTPVGAAVLLNMVEDEKSWMEIGIDPRMLKSPFSDAYSLIKENYKILKNFNNDLTLFHCMMVTALKDPHERDAFLEAIAKNPDLFKNQVKFVKNLEHNPSEGLLKNRLYLMVNGVIIKNKIQLQKLASHSTLKGIPLEEHNNEIRTPIELKLQAPTTKYFFNKVSEIITNKNNHAQLPDEEKATAYFNKSSYLIDNSLFFTKTQTISNETAPIKFPDPETFTAEELAKYKKVFLKSPYKFIKAFNEDENFKKFMLIVLSEKYTKPAEGEEELTVSRQNGL